MTNNKIKRRVFLKGGITASLGAVISTIFPESTIALDSGATSDGTNSLESIQSETYEDFLIYHDFVPHEARSRSGYKPSNIPMKVTAFDSVEEAIEYSQIPFYALPANIYPHYQLENILVSEVGDVSELFIDYAITESKGTEHEVRPVSIFATRDYDNPVVVIPTHSLDETTSEGDPITVLPEKVDFTPTPGLITPSYGGYLVQWVENSVHYKLQVENDDEPIDQETVINVLNSLKRVEMFTERVFMPFVVGGN